MTAAPASRSSANSSRRSGYIIHWSAVFLLLLLSHATNASSEYPSANNGNPNDPSHRPTNYDQRQQHHQQQPQSSTESSPQQFVPLIKVEHVALSLRLTCERNRRLKRGSTFGIRRQPEIVVEHPEPHNIAARAATTPNQQQSTEDDEPITLFHAMTRRDTPEIRGRKILRGEEQWGPSMRTVIEEIVSNILHLTEDETSIVLSLSMIYLDRASSVETLRSNGAPACPFNTFRTVHRLFLTCILTAAQVVGKPIADYYDQLEDLVGVTPQEIQEMMAWMKYALGDSGHFVGLGEMQKFKLMWERVFNIAASPSMYHANSGHSQNQHQSGASVAPSGFFSSTAEPRQAQAPSDGHVGKGAADQQQQQQQQQQQRNQQPGPAFVNTHKQPVVAAS